MDQDTYTVFFQSPQAYEVGSINILILQTRTPKLRNAELFSLGPTTSKGQAGI